ncbi:HPP family protein [Paraburkholderia humisilvae]|uniref:HPP family protein n=1 Tax=Paraburkholderia humisilvae TaxID=627669 RepID=UPI0015817E8B|nr:HPP family protein [Paraburkholderia humisilvae]
MRWLSSFVPGPILLNWPERVRSAAGAFVGLALTATLMQLVFGSSAAFPMLIAPMGASAVLLFAVPASPLAQPWSLIGGNLVSATVGVACAMLIPDPFIAAAIAAAGAIAGMFTLRCVHPPSGAVALTAVLGGPAIRALGFHFVLEPVFVQSALLLGSAMVYHTITGHRYPHVAPIASEATTDAAQHPSLRSDLEAVLRRRSELLDVNPDDLETLLRETEMQAYSRNFGELSCRDIMSNPVISVTPDATAGTASYLLNQHRIKALPVVTEDRRVVGIVTRANLAGGAAEAIPSVLNRWRQRWLAPRPSLGIARQVRRTSVKELMTTHVHTVSVNAPIVELVPLFATHGHHHIPVLDTHRRLAGIITQADLIAGLYRRTRSPEYRAA